MKWKKLDKKRFKDIIEQAELSCLATRIIDLKEKIIIEVSKEFTFEGSEKVIIRRNLWSSLGVTGKFPPPNLGVCFPPDGETVHLFFVVFRISANIDILKYSNLFLLASWEDLGFFSL